jgi:hypothetical protein
MVDLLVPNENQYFFSFIYLDTNLLALFNNHQNMFNLYQIIF